jgi:hypothetical protein
MQPCIKPMVRLACSTLQDCFSSCSISCSQQVQWTHCLALLLIAGPGFPGVLEAKSRQVNKCCSLVLAQQLSCLQASLQQQPRQHLLVKTFCGVMIHDLCVLIYDHCMLSQAHPRRGDDPPQRQGGTGRGVAPPPVSSGPNTP